MGGGGCQLECPLDEDVFFLGLSEADVLRFSWAKGGGGGAAEDVVLSDVGGLYVYAVEVLAGAD